jgi:adenosylhomocysteine nucleosidase
MIGITFALPAESSDLMRQLHHVEDVDGLRFGQIGSRDVAVVHTGVGSEICNERLEILLHKARPEFIITSGFAGAVSEQLQAGNLILAENFSDPTLLGLARGILRDSKTTAVKLFTSSSIVNSPAQRNEIARASGAAAVDMETGAILEICKAHGMWLVSLRAITDTPSNPFPAPPDILFDIEGQRTNYGRLFSYILRHPGSIGPLVRFGRRISKVRASLTDALVALIREL